MVAALVGLNLDAPALTDWKDLETRLNLGLPTPGDTSQSLKKTVRLSFNGTMASGDGPKQRLQSENIVPAKAGISEPSPLLMRIYWARPDLRTKMVEMGMVPSGFEKRNSPQGGGPLIPSASSAFEKQESWMGYYPPADLGSDSAYTIARTPLQEGAFFKHQLVPILADDIWEYGWVLGLRQVYVSGSVFRAVEIAYLIDLGESKITNETGEILGTFRSYSICLLALSPNVGPVYQRGLDYLVPGGGIYFDEMKLLEYNVEL